jgi:hypothetical protein
MGRGVEAKGCGDLEIMIGGTVKEGEGCNEAEDGKNFDGEEVGGVDEAGNEDKAEELLARPLLRLV